MTRYEAFIEKSWRESGVTQLLVARIRSDGRAEIGFFLLDLWCLGVKDAFLCADDTEAAFQLILSERLPAEFRERIHPACAKKLIEGALAYAEALGFAPARDYRKARRALSGLDATACPETFTFGRNGKPYYIQGPNDDSARVDRVLTVLKARCGADGFTYLLTDADADPETDDLATDAREALREFVAALGPETMDFYSFAGLVAASHIGPDPLSPEDFLKGFILLTGVAWHDEDDLRNFTRNFAPYWISMGEIVAASAASPNPDTGMDLIDIYADDFDGPDGPAPMEDLAAAFISWSAGFMLATRTWPGAWGDALGRTDLAPHWEIIRAWSEPEKPEHQGILSRTALSASADPSLTLPAAVAALARALRPPPPVS